MEELFTGTKLYKVIVIDREPLRIVIRNPGNILLKTLRGEVAKDFVDQIGQCVLDSEINRICEEFIS